MTTVWEMEDFANLFWILACAALAVVLLEVGRRHARARRHDLRKAREALDRHFEALKTVTESAIPSDSAKRLMLQLSTAVNQRHVACAIARSIKAGERPQLSSAHRTRLDKVLAEVREIRERNDEIASAVRDVIVFGFVAMFIRWPETDGVMSDVMVQEAEIDESHAVREKAEWMISEIDDNPLGGHGFGGYALAS